MGGRFCNDRERDFTSCDPNETGTCQPRPVRRVDRGIFPGYGAEPFVTEGISLRNLTQASLNMRHRLLLAIALILISAVPCFARVIEQKSGTAIDIQAAVDLAHPGDPVAIPAG